MTNSLAGTPVPEQAPDLLVPKYTDQFYLDLFDRLKKESFEYRHVWEREWLRDIYYVGNRQWITYHPTKRDWIDKRFDKDIPRPVTNKMAEVLQAIRANLSAIKLDVTVRPIGNDPESMAAAEVADQLSPLIYEEHDMTKVMREADFWFIVTGNACLQVGWDRDKRFNRIFIKHEQCLTCGTVLPPQVIAESMNMCPVCMGTQFAPAQNQDGTPAGEWLAYGRGKTTALSPFEYAMPPNIVRFDDLPYMIRLRWRDRHYYEANMPEVARQLTWEKSPTDRSLQIYKSLALVNDVGTSAQFAYLGAGGAHTVDGVTEYELWQRPTPEFPEGLLLRVAGEKSPVLIKVNEEGIPGPFPFKDKEGFPIFPFAHAPYEHMGGRLYGRSAISPLVQKQDQLNQLDSLTLMQLQTTANPVWIVPEGAGIDHFTGKPGLVMKWNPLAAGGQGKPERIAGESLSGGLFELRAQYLKDIEELSGTYDIIKGQKPTGVEAFSAIQALIERSQARFGSAYSARGEMFRRWFGVALELERNFGPDQRTFAVTGPHRGYTFHHFENAQLQRQVSVHIEDGNQAQKTSLGRRAAIEQANQLGLIDPSDPEQRYAILTQFGLPDLTPSLDIHIQSALQMQDAFERWMENPVGMNPLTIKPWHNPQIHWSERIKWLNTDRMREKFQAQPQFEQFVALHLQQLQFLMAPPPMEGGPGPGPGGPGPGAPKETPPVGSGQAMSRSNANSTSTETVPRGNREDNQEQGPV
jgi:hypothetical protein